MSNQSLRHVFVSNNKTLLAEGSTVDKLGVGQVGIIDAKTYTGVTTPTYAKDKAIYLVQGTPDLGDGALMDGQYNQNLYSKLIKGKNIVDFKGKKSKKGQNQIVTVGWSGDIADDNTISALNGDQRHLYVTLSGGPIDKLYSKQGVTRHYIQEYPINSDCTDVCGEVDRRKVAEDFALQINADPYINKFVKASVIQTCTPDLDALPTQTVYKFTLTIADSQDGVALGLVQSQYPTSNVTRIGTDGLLSVYEVQKTTNSAPTAHTNAGLTVITDCEVCPSGYTKTVGGYAYEVRRADAGSSGNLATIVTDYAVASSGESATRVNYEFGTSTYIVIANAATTAVGEDEFTFIGQNSSFCVLTTPTTTTWAGAGTLTQYGKEYTITLGDTICGSNRLAELQAFYPDLTIAIVDAGGTCVHSYSTTIYSDPIEVGCSVDLLNYTDPQAFDGVQWIAAEDAALPDGTVCKTGIKIEVAYYNRVTNECTYDYFPYEMDTVHLAVSTFDPVYNDAPNQADWAVKQIQSVQFPAGYGPHVRLEEQKSLSYALKERSFDPVIREIQGYAFQAQPQLYYDEYTLYFEYTVLVGGWGQKETYKYAWTVYFPSGNGKNFERAINGYLASANINIEPVVL